MEDYEKLQKENEQLISKFSASFESRNSSGRIIRSHVSNLELLNDYLSGYDEIKLQVADAYDIECFLNWCIDKWIFNTASGFASAISSVKMFYEYLEQIGVKSDIKGIIEVCKDKDKYMIKFNKHERLLDRH